MKGNKYIFTFEGFKDEVKYKNIDKVCDVLDSYCGVKYTYDGDSIQCYIDAYRLYVIIMPIIKRKVKCRVVYKDNMIQIRKRRFGLC